MGVILERLKNGLFKENAIFVQVIAMCPTLAVTTSATNGIGMGLATTAVLVGANVVISALRKVIPDKIRIPAFIVVIASFVTLLEFLMKGYVPALYQALGLFIPLIVVNCVILGRAEAYASKNNVFASLFDGLGMGLGFTLALVVLGTVREVLGAGTLFGFHVLPASYKPALIMILAPGAFFALGIIMAIMNAVQISKTKQANTRLANYDCSHCAHAATCGQAFKMDK
ncbi:electron transport complex subunit E [Clostridium sp. SYSU_GA19001]|uniref:electron transport complex subunit RsxE n=1 Tax=Clostridium caldaquaticum TaxID=2940653 RepID=UPI0020770A67|nr:electron transport complex subunit E [Clostridium caldaquaticum]MCM8709824.1 electron transport complex subunit E [Clostridium caldaquaticum]